MSGNARKRSSFSAASVYESASRNARFVAPKTPLLDELYGRSPASALGKSVASEMLRESLLSKMLPPRQMAAGVHVSAVSAVLGEGYLKTVLGPDPFGFGKSLPRSSASRASVFASVYGKHMLTSDLLGLANGLSGFPVLSALGVSVTGSMKTPWERLEGYPGRGGGLPLALASFVTKPLTPKLPQLAEEFAELLFPENLQGFSDDEWSRLIEMCVQDGIGLLGAPGKAHLQSLLAAPDRAARYAYLLEQKDAILDELEEGLDQVHDEELEDLAELARQAVACARAGVWEGALALAANVLTTAMDHHGIPWYRAEFDGLVNSGRQPITGFTGAGATIRWVLDAVPLPERAVGIFDLRAHLVIRPLAEVFLKDVPTQDTFNRHLVAHHSSYDSFREEFVLPALLNAHALLRGIDDRVV
ncbi:hypothetical protein [Streptomyces flavofungini]|uniref:hypothetical protein n=1 Tax=Streptomyces flavofungini TaxID=68200 RepID=UPI0025B218E3|nr:hypothetical protein [Streptomyces flavofungini]WJV51748.1 hypothetical protein QUY26_39665 [Streptomyces flavofungini]